MAKKVVLPTITTDPEVQKLSQALYDRTVAQVGKYFGVGEPYVKPEELVVPDKLKSIIEAINEGDWGCQRDSVIKLVSAITGSDITPYLDEKKNDPDTVCIDSEDLLTGVILVPTLAENHHGYPLEKPCMVVYPESDENLMDMEGDINCDSIDLDVRCLRMPTLDEIIIFVTLNLKVVKKYIVLG